MKALIFGTILFDVFPDEVLIGGCSTNVASHCALLGAETTHLSRIGDDKLGRLALEHFAGVGVDTGFVTTDPEHATGRVDVTVHASGQPEYVLSTDAAYDFISLTGEQIEAIAGSGYDFIYFGTVDQRGGVSAATLRKLLDTGAFRHVFCDINLRDNCYTPDSVAFSLARSTILKMNEDELRVIPRILDLPCAASDYDEARHVGEIMERFDIPLAILTKSDKGATAYSSNGEAVHRTGKSVTVCDAVGAGDAFSAAFILAYIATKNLIAALDAGNLLGGYVASQKGAVPVSARYPRDLVARVSGKT